MKYLILIAILFVTFLGCTKKQHHKQPKKFENKKILKGTIINFEDTPLCPDRVSTYDSLLLLKNWKNCNKYFFYIYNKNSKLLGKFGKKGRGPSEFIKPHIYGNQFNVLNKALHLWVFDFQSQRLKNINIQKSISNPTASPSQIISIPNKIGTVTKVINLPKKLIGKSISSKGRMFFYNKESTEIKWINFIPKVKNEPKDIHNLYNAQIDIKPDRSKIVSALRYFNRIDMFDLNGNLKMSLTSKRDNKDPSTTNSKKQYYFDVYCTNKYIYALKGGFSLKKLKKGKDLQFKVEVYNWDGKPIRLYKLDRFIGSIVIDNAQRYIYGISKKQKIIRYNL